MFGLEAQHLLCTSYCDDLHMLDVPTLLLDGLCCDQAWRQTILALEQSFSQESHWGELVLYSERFSTVSREAMLGGALNIYRLRPRPLHHYFLKQQQSSSCISLLSFHLNFEMFTQQQKTARDYWLITSYIYFLLLLRPLTTCHIRALDGCLEEESLLIHCLCSFKAQAVPT